MTDADYTHDEWQKDRAWAQRIVGDAEKYPEHYSDRAHLVLAARALLDLPEPKKPPRTFADMTDEERRDHIGGAVETEGQRGWYVGEDDSDPYALLHSAKSGISFTWLSCPELVTPSRMSRA